MAMHQKVVKLIVKHPEDVANFIGYGMTAGLVAMQLQTSGRSCVNYQGTSYDFWLESGVVKEVEAAL